METYRPLCPLLSAVERNAQQVCMGDNCAWYVQSYTTTGMPGIPMTGGATVPGGCALHRLAITLDKMYREP